MTTVQDVAAELWREVSRHLEIQQSAVALAGILGRHMPLAALVVRDLVPERRAVNTVGVGALQERLTIPQHTDCSAAEFRRVMAWCRRGVVSEPEVGGSPPPWHPLLDGLAGDAIVAPLVAPGGPLGVVVLVSRLTTRFAAVHRGLVQELLEPLTIALQNDHRLRELAVLRDAAEADRRSLLTRLGREEFVDAIVGADAGLHGVMERIRLVARSDLPVLILGETGTGKEVIARAIHTGSPRASGPFIRVNCGAIPSELVDSHLFGHEKGSFTGAVDQRRGWFERANGGTLLLDEIGELSLAAQVRLLRVLQDGMLERVGGQEPIRADVRIVAATHQDLAAMAVEHRFREDLWYRLAVFPILLPPLRDRLADIPALARHFARRAAIRLGLPERMPEEADLALLADYPWPGNVRELATVLDRAAILGKGERLLVGEALGFARGPAMGAVPARDRAGPASDGDVATAAPAAADGVGSLDEAMRQHIGRALGAAHGRIEGPFGAAKLLRVNPHTLRSRMRRLGIAWGGYRRRPAPAP